MDISIREFQVAMETFGAERLSDLEDSMFKTLLPCFKIEGIEFFISNGKIFHRGQNVPDSIMYHAMSEFGEEHLDVANFWRGKVQSIKGILTLATMLRGDYSEELVNELTNIAYKKLLEDPLFRSNIIEFPEFSNHSTKMQKLRKLLQEYSNIVNPFGNSDFKFKEPIRYLDKVNVSITADAKESSVNDFKMNLKNEFSRASFYYNSIGWQYHSRVLIQKEQKEGYSNFSHYYYNGSGVFSVKELVVLDTIMTDAPYSIFKPMESIFLEINLKTGLVSTKDHEEVPATDEELDIVIAYLRKHIGGLKKNIIRSIVDKKS